MLRNYLTDLVKLSQIRQRETDIGPKRYNIEILHCFAIALRQTAPNQLLMAHNCSGDTSDCLRSTSSKRVNQSLMTVVELTCSTVSSKCMSIEMSSGRKTH